MKTFFFDTGVRLGIPATERHTKGSTPVTLSNGQVLHNGTVQIPFDCDNVPENEIFKYACECADAE